MFYCWYETYLNLYPELINAELEHLWLAYQAGEEHQDGTVKNLRKSVKEFHTEAKRKQKQYNLLRTTYRRLKESYASMDAGAIRELLEETGQYCPIAGLCSENPANPTESAEKKERLRSAKHRRNGETE